MRFEDFSSGSVGIDWVTEVSRRVLHTPLFVEEAIPWKCRRLFVGTGAYGKLPVMDELKLEAERPQN